MDFLIADTFIAALSRLPAQDQKDVKVSLADLQINPTMPALKLHRIDRSKDPYFWSARVNRDMRMVLHKSQTSTLAAFVGHHDEAYAWAVRRKIAAHPKTGALQIVELPSRIAEVQPELAEYWSTGAYRRDGRDGSSPVFSDMTVKDMLAIGVPPDWTGPLRVVNEDGFLAVAPYLPAEVADKLMSRAVANEFANGVVYGKCSPAAPADGMSIGPQSIPSAGPPGDLGEPRRSSGAIFAKRAPVRPSTGASIQPDRSPPFAGSESRPVRTNPARPAIGMVQAERRIPSSPNQGPWWREWIRNSPYTASAACHPEARRHFFNASTEAQLNALLDRVDAQKQKGELAIRN